MFRLFLGGPHVVFNPATPLQPESALEGAVGGAGVLTFGLFLGGPYVFFCPTTRLGALSGLYAQERGSDRASIRGTVPWVQVLEFPANYGGHEAHPHYTTDWPIYKRTANRRRYG